MRAAEEMTRVLLGAALGALALCGGGLAQPKKDPGEIRGLKLGQIGLKLGGALNLSKQGAINRRDVIESLKRDNALAVNPVTGVNLVTSNINRVHDVSLKSSATKYRALIGRCMLARHRPSWFRSTLSHHR